MRKILFFLVLILLGLVSSISLAKEKIAEDDFAPQAIITIAEMDTALAEDTANGSPDKLYVKIGEDRVEVYQGLATNRSLRKQLILKMPNTEMLRLYTANKSVEAQMSKMLLDYENDNTNFNGYKIITDKDLPKKLANGQKIYRFWFMKIAREKASRSHNSFPIGIGIGIGGGHHGPWIGIGI